MNKEVIKNKIIAISGQPVTGKSTTIKTLKNKLLEQGYKEENIHTISTGEQFRKYFNTMVEFIKNLDNPDKLEKTKEMETIMKSSESRNAFIKSLIELKDAKIDLSKFSVEQANSLKELNEVRQIIDNLIDEDIKQKGIEINQEERPNDIWIFDSRLAFHNIPEAFSVRLTSNPEVAAQRVFNDQTRGKEDKYKTVKEALVARENRRKGEQERYKKRYGVDLEDDKNYDLIIDTSYSKPEDIADTIVTCLDRYKENKKFAQKWASPKIFLPLQGERETGNGFNDVLSSIAEFGYIPSEAIETVEVDGRQYIIEGHHRNFALASLGKTLVPYEVLAKDDEEVPIYKGATARQRAESLEKLYLTGHEQFIEFGENGKTFSYKDIYPDVYDKFNKEKEDSER